MVGIFYDTLWSKINAAYYRSILEQHFTDNNIDYENGADLEGDFHDITYKYINIPDEQWPDDIPDFVIDEVYDARNLISMHGALNDISQIRPYGWSNEISDAVSNWSKNRFGVNLKKSYIRHCRELYRQMKRSRLRKL